MNYTVLFPGAMVYRIDLAEYMFADDIFEDASVYTSKNTRDTSIRNCKFVNVDMIDDQAYITPIQQAIQSCYEHYTSHFSLPKQEIVISSQQLLKYGVGEMFKQHVDDHPMFPRLITSLAYLNDSYTGGEVYFKYQDVTYAPKLGDILFFPSNFVYNHEVKEVTSGQRLTLVTWYRWTTVKNSYHQKIDD